MEDTAKRSCAMRPLFGGFGGLVGREHMAQRSWTMPPLFGGFGWLEEGGGEVSFGTVGEECGDRSCVAGGELSGGPEVGAGGDTDEEAMIAAELACGFDGVFVGDFDDFVDEIDIEDGGDEAIANALDLVEAWFVAQEGGGVFGFDGDDTDVGVLLFEVGADALEGAARTDAGDKAVYIALDLPVEFGAGLLEVDSRVVGVFELLADEEVRVFVLHLAGAFDGAVDGFVGWGENESGAESGDEFFAFEGHIFGHDDGDGEAAESANEGKADAGVSGGRFEEGHRGFEAAGGDGGIDHGESDAVLYGAAGIEELGLCEDVFVADLKERGISDEVEYGSSVHGYAPCGAVGVCCRSPWGIGRSTGER